MSSTKQLLKQLENLSNPRNLEEAKVYNSLAHYYSSRYRTDSAFSDHSFAAAALYNYHEEENFRNLCESLVGCYYYGTAMTAARKQTSDREARKIIAFKLLVKDIQEKYSSPFQAREEYFMMECAYKKYHPKLV